MSRCKPCWECAVCGHLSRMAGFDNITPPNCCPMCGQMRQGWGQRGGRFASSATWWKPWTWLIGSWSPAPSAPPPASKEGGR